ncbi:MAG: ABC transporter ATP-binding protein [Synergistaceae bacterium]|jgi:ABC-type glutathione transport system ATPase component|nr:ABC transporter ATP-binding protein [Synergistaceae bacterium]
MSVMRDAVAIELKNLSVTYRGGEGGRTVHAVRDCSFSVARGDVLGIVGESGSGKSSVLMAIPRLLPASALVTGGIFCDGTEISSLDERGMGVWRWRRIALVPQSAMNSFTPHITIERHITEVLEHHMRTPRRDARERAEELLWTVRLDGSAGARYPHELSGGQKQRAALATALACGPDFLLADEPTTALDVITQKEVLDMTVSLVRERGMGLLLVTHDLPLAAGICDSLVVMREGAIVESGPSQQVASNPENDYTKLLIGAIRDMERPRGLEETPARKTRG